MITKKLLYALFTVAILLLGISMLPVFAEEDVTGARPGSEGCPHDFGDWYTVDDATCTKSGTEQRSCRLCWGKQTRTTDPLGHDYVEIKETSYGPTCDNPGNISYQCQRCYDVTHIITPATGHSFGEWKVTRQNGCSWAGSKERVCSVCGSVETKEIPAVGKHILGKWRISKEPGALECGFKARDCKTCTYFIEKPIPKKKGYVRFPSSVLRISKGQAICFPEDIVVDMANVDATKLQLDKYYDDYVVSWKSSNKKVVSISKEGVIRGVRPGTATIKVKMKSGAKASCKIIVQAKKIHTKKIKKVSLEGHLMKKSIVRLNLGNLGGIRVSLDPVTSEDEITYKSSNEKVATVDKTGLLRSTGVGKAKIRVTSGKKSATFTVIVE